MKNWRPEEVTTDKAKALIGAVEDLLPHAAHDTSVYANNRGRVRSLPAEGTAETDARFAAAQVLYERVPADTTATTSSCRARTASVVIRFYAELVVPAGGDTDTIVGCGVSAKFRHGWLGFGNSRQ